MNTRKYSPIMESPVIFVPAEGATMNMVWNRITPRNTLPMDAFSTDAPPTSKAAIQNIPTLVWAL